MMYELFWDLNSQLQWCGWGYLSSGDFSCHLAAMQVSFVLNNQIRGILSLFFRLPKEKWTVRKNAAYLAALSISAFLPRDSYGDFAEKQNNTASLPHNLHPFLHNVILNRFDPKPTRKERRYSSHTPYGLVLTKRTFPFATK